MIRVLALLAAFAAAPALACDVPFGKDAASATLINYTNALRAKRSKPTLGVSDALTRAAQKHACYMAATGKFSHQGQGGSSVSQRISAEGYGWLFAAENIAYGYDDPQRVGAGWRKSKGHRQNMMHDKARQIGIGWARAGGRDYWVMVLAAPR